MLRTMRASREMIPGVLRLQAEVFGLPVQHFQELIERDPWFKPENVLVGLLCDRPTSALQIFPKPVRIGDTPARAGGIGNVATLPGFRGKGYATRLLAEAIQLMKNEHYGLSILFTKIPDFYRRLKWEVASPRYKFVIPAAKARDSNSYNFQIEPLRKNDLDAVMRIYEAENSCRTLSVLRSKECWLRQLEHRLDETTNSITIKKGDMVLAYGRYKITEKRVWIIEAGCLPGPDSKVALKDLLTFIGEQALHNDRPLISVYAPPDHPLVKEVLKRGGLDKSRPNSGLMVRIISLRDLLEEILPELNRRASSHGLSGRIRIRTEEESISLVIKGGETNIAPEKRTDEIYKVKHSTLAQHLTGYLTPSQALRRGLAKAKPSTAKLVDALFRVEKAPYFWRYDRF